MVDITPIIPSGRQLLESYGEGRFRVSGILHEGSVLVLPDRTLPWPVTGMADVTAASFAPLEADRPEILLLGCGAKMVLVPPALRTALRAHGMVVDAMDTGAACRTYNVLLAEGRRVAAALIAI